MLKKLIEYTDYNGKQRKENFYFALNKAELMEMELGTVGGMQNLIQLIIDKQDIPEIVKTFKMLVLKSYGEKSADGVRFIKSDELSTAFSQTEAYANLFMELISDANAAAAFINGIVPADLVKSIQEDEEAAKTVVEEKLAEIKEIAPAAAPVEDGSAHLLG